MGLTDRRQTGHGRPCWVQRDPGLPHVDPRLRIGCRSCRQGVSEGQFEVLDGLEGGHDIERAG
jgi:hypothetical protein